MRGLDVGRVDGHRSNDFGCVDALGLAAPFAVDVHGVEDAVGAARGDGAGLLIEPVDLAHLVAVQHLSDHGEHFRFELRAARAQISLQQVDEGVQAEDLVQEVVVLHAAVVHGAGALPPLPRRVFVPGHGGKLFQDLCFVPALLGQLGEDLEALVVGVHIPKEIERILFVRHVCLVGWE